MNRSFLALPMALSLFAGGCHPGEIVEVMFPAGAQSITVNWSTPQQVIDGFGMSSASTEITLSAPQADFFFSTSGTNLGLSLLRIRIYPDLADCQSNEGGSGTCTGSTSSAVANYDLANAKAAAARRINGWAAEWSPPASMKSTGLFMAGGSLVGNATNYTKLAAIQTSFVTLLNSSGVPIYALSPQNEPDMSKPYSSCTWTAQQIHDYVPYLSAALATAGYSSVKIIVAEQSGWSSTLSIAAMNDASVAANISILAAHGYNSGASLLSWNNFTTQHVWQSEVSDFNPYDGTMTSGLTYASEIHRWLTTANVNAWHYWEGPNGPGGYTDNEALEGIDGSPAKRAYTFGNYAKFIRPGWRRVGVSNSGSLLVTAFKDPTGAKSAIVVVNSGSEVSNQVFSIGAQMGGTVIPWITSSSKSLEQQVPVAVSGGSVTYTIPANSVVTLSGDAAPVASNARSALMECGAMFTFYQKPCQFSPVIR